MATTTQAAEPQVQDGEEREGIEHPLLLAALLARREEGEGIEHPLLLAALLRRREEGEERRDEIHPLLLAALLARLEEREKEPV